LFRLRWPRCDNAGHDGLLTVDWQRHYWEKHLQECLDEAAESALLPSFYGSIDELTIPAKIVSCILHSKDISQQYSRLSYHCSRFGRYARCLRLQSVLCTAEISVSADAIPHISVILLYILKSIDQVASDVSFWLLSALLILQMPFMVPFFK
jgi:hypothetical protein